MKHFCIYTNTHKDKELIMTNRVREFLEQKGMHCVIRTQETGEDMPDVDCILVLGGDGTMLKAARDMKSRKRVPLLGINLGTLGYLTEVEPDNVETALSQLLSGDYELESRMMLNGSIYRKNGEKQEDWALNDIVISKSGVGQVINYNVYVNRKLLHKYVADGMIVTTPTGSTGYNLSAGGPIVEPSAKLLVLTPICPHTMNQRSVVLSSEDEVVIELPPGREGQMQCATLNFDGYAVEMKTGDAVRIVRSERTTEFIKLSKAGFLEILHKKMSDT